MSDFIKSPYCDECGGNGCTPALPNHWQVEQCEECERQTEMERRADIAHDIARGD